MVLFENADDQAVAGRVPHMPEVGRQRCL